jgi:hypothetical protein
MRLFYLFLIALLLAAFAGGARAQSLEKSYQETLAAYKEALEGFDRCSRALDELQKQASQHRPKQGASREEWDKWATTYLEGADRLVNCLREYKREADDLKKKLDELEKQLDAISAGNDKGDKSREPDKTDEEKKEEADELAKKAKADLSRWNYDVKY